MGWYEPTRRRAAKGGIKALSKTGQFGQSWWAKRWIATLESFDIGSRLTRGRSYARSGQVLSIDIDTGTVHAKVQGSRPTPYKVKITVKTLTDEQWRSVASALTSQAYYAAKLIGGEMPDTIEEVFVSVGLTLFPASLKDLTTDCSCPDWSNPCKHIAAVYYLLGEEFDRDPFLIFRLRGTTRESIASRLTGFATEDSESVAPEPEPLQADLTGFWQLQAPAIDAGREVRVPPVHAALPKRLGSLPFWRGSAPMIETLLPVYVRTSRAGESILSGEFDPNQQY